MNERILNLAEQAGIAVWGDAVYMYNPKDTLDSAVLEKFAELIVQECVDIASQEDFDVMMKEGYLCSQTAKKIKEHFGVEK